MFNRHTTTYYVEVFFKNGKEPFRTYANSVKEVRNMLYVTFDIEKEEWIFPLTDIDYVKKS